MKGAIKNSVRMSKSTQGSGGSAQGSQRTARNDLATMGAGLASRHRWHHVVSARQSCTAAGRPPTLDEGEPSRLAFIKHGSIGQGGRLGGGLDGTDAAAWNEAL